MHFAFKHAVSGRGIALLPGGVHQQVAALCYRDTDAGKEVLLITSRRSGRWIIPKGWPVAGKDGPGSALQEAWEEAGVCRADMTAEAMGTFAYSKNQNDGARLLVVVEVYLTRVDAVAADYPEAEERRRVWVSPDEAARRIMEPELKDMLRRL